MTALWLPTMKLLKEYSFFSIHVSFSFFFLIRICCCCYLVGFLLKTVNGYYKWFVLGKFNEISNAQIQNTVKFPLKRHRLFVTLQYEHLTLSWSLKCSCCYCSTSIWIFIFQPLLLSCNHVLQIFHIPERKPHLPLQKYGRSSNHMSHFRYMKDLQNEYAKTLIRENMCLFSGTYEIKTVSKYPWTKKLLISFFYTVKTE